MPKFQLKTPVAFIIFNRLDTSERVFAEIAKARPPKLLVVADGPRIDHPEDMEKCAATREIIKRVDWDCEVLTNFSDTNLGCKRRVSSGIDWVFDQVEEAIILEDDCQPHPSFFRFCQEMLHCYRDDERIMMIGGTNYLLDQLDIRESYCFSRHFAIWGWATWGRSWRKYDVTMKNWDTYKKEGQLKSFYSQRYMWRHITCMFDMAYRNRIDTWDIQWVYSCLFNNGLCIVPKVNLISNIGLVGAHTCVDDSFNFFPVFVFDVENIAHPDLVYPNYRYDNALYKHYVTVPLFRRMRNLTRKIMSYIRRTNG